MATEDQKTDIAPLLLAGGLGAAPFAGLIGERPITKDPFHDTKIKRLSPEKLEQIAREGDVMLASRREGGSVRYKQPQLYATGSEFYHAEPVVGRHRPKWDNVDTGKLEYGKRTGRTIDAGKMDFIGKNVSPQEILKKGPGEFGQRMPLGAYEDIVLMRPNRKLSKADIKKLQLSLISEGAKPYSKGMGLSALMRDLFIPKVNRVSDKLGPAVPKMICEGNMCSSLPAASWQGTFGESIAKGKHPKFVLPADFLREGSPFTPVASSLTNPEALKNLTAKRMAFRGGLGAALAGTGLASYYEPEVLPGIAAAAGAPLASRAVLNYLHQKKPGTVKNLKLRALLKRFKPKKAGDFILPTNTAMAENASGLMEVLRRTRGTRKKMPKAWKSLLGRYGGRTLPLALGSGLAAYLGTKALTD